jgi:hypothetical protein
MRSKICATTAFVVLVLFAPVRAECNPPKTGLFHTTYEKNFSTCKRNIELILSSNDSSLYQGCFVLPLEDETLSLEGCHKLCGNGEYKLWPFGETWERLTLFIIPTVILVSRLQFPPLPSRVSSVVNAGIVICHALGNPIASLWALLSRFEIHRGFHTVVQEITAEDINSYDLSRNQQRHVEVDIEVLRGAIATLLAAFEEHGWQMVWQDFRQSIKSKPLDYSEICLIIQASYNISPNRIHSKSKALVAIGLLISSLMTAIFRTIAEAEETQDISRIKNETAHTIAVCCMLFVLIPQVWFAARLGTFNIDSFALEKLNEMNRGLTLIRRENGRREQLFPMLEPQKATSVNGAASDENGENGREDGLKAENPQKLAEFSNTWLKHGVYLGANSSWRPMRGASFERKKLDTAKLWFYALAFVILGAVLPAYFLSGTNHADKRDVGLGCRSLTWVVIMGVWLLNLGIDTLVHSFHHLAERGDQGLSVPFLRALWYFSIFKDALITGGLVAAVLVIEVGRYNSCWCRASFEKGIILKGWTTVRWKQSKNVWILVPLCGLVTITLLTIAAEHIPWRERRRGSPLCKSSEEMCDEASFLRQSLAE